MNKKLLVVLCVTIVLLTACSNENTENKSVSPHQKNIDSLALEKEQKAIEVDKLKHELDSLKKHLDSIKEISTDSLK